jgi:tetratricopeptide (TPR) repeat protein
MIFAACATSSQETSQRPLTGSISYPFVGETRSLGKTNPRQPFVVRSAVGAHEYTVEIPDNAAKYDIQIPVAELAPRNAQDFGASPLAGGRRQSNPANTDKELVSALPDLGKSKSGKTEMLDAAFGVGKPEGPIQSPSYTLGIARVNQHFKNRDFELALVELNNLLAFYPNSPKLLKMKGTLLVKTGNRELAMKSWQRALDLSPGDLALKTSINNLNERILAEKNARSSNSQNTPGGLSQPTDPEALLDRAAH